MSRRPDTVVKLQAELDAAMPDPLSIRVIPSPTSKHSISHESFDLMGYALPPGTGIATWACFMNSRPRRVPPAAHLPPQPVALHDRGPTRADAGAFLAFPRGILDLWEHGACDDNDAHYSPGTLRSTRRKGQMRRDGPEG
ncbi:hypothetical protein FIBSPDRAFT_854121 [Athelia psychrophila]|uniref:Uncharacterized protein n=1 Tax=Athelia psychrophila TaxID=1759441 RepID=A0A166QJY4_9AGAM|nr:hypothetical protein FIBSPDRAFT_854121 [Fibularhizoctonia sp. CBS 109695]